MPPNWLEDFAPFTLLHALTVSVCLILIAGSCLIGRRICRTLHEPRFRAAWGWFGIAVAIAYATLHAWPSRFALDTGLPLHICDLGMIVAAMAMLRPNRLWRSLLYFWGIGLSVQAFITPTLGFGPAYAQFWLFWACHLVIVGSAVYDLLIGGYRPTGRDFLLALAVTLAYGVLIAAFDGWLGVNYGFLGPTKPSNPTLIDRLGPWPRRVPVIFAMGAAEFLLLWLLWPLARRLSSAGPRPSAPP
jgi:hypothetical integral membrane protein (TIGR02206 family)